MESPTLRIAIIGGGPRGIGVLERIASRVLQTHQQHGIQAPIEVTMIDQVEVGCGQIWRTDQPEWFLMNTLASELTAFSGPRDSGPDRAGAGPTFSQWWDEIEPGIEHLTPYATRACYGEYLKYTTDSIIAGLPGVVCFRAVLDSVIAVDRTESGPRYLLNLASGRHVMSDRIVYTTGHSRRQLTGAAATLAAATKHNPHLTFMPAQSPAELPLARIPAGQSVGLIGMGLTFYDIVTALTLGRGGHYRSSSTGRLEYQPSGAEPRLVAGSRSGLPQPARGRNQRPADFRHQPIFFSADLIRRRAQGPIDWLSDIQPALAAEVDLVFYAAVLRSQNKPAQAETLVFLAGQLSNPKKLRGLADSLGLGDHQPPDFDQLARPFSAKQFTDPSTFTTELLAHVDADLHQAEQGNVESPVKAALDVLRSLRWTIRELVDFCGLTAESHRHHLDSWYSPRSAFLAAGPPLIRLQQLRALIEAGVLRVVGPNAQFTVDGIRNFIVSSPQVHGSKIAVKTIIDARIPSPDASSDISPLTQSLLSSGQWTPHRNFNGSVPFTTGAVAITPSPFHPIGADGHPDVHAHVLGIPTEGVRWFTQVVGTGARRWSDFMRDADDVARSVLTERSRPTVDSLSPVHSYTR
jgi:hypothetical protein